MSSTAVDAFRKCLAAISPYNAVKEALLLTPSELTVSKKIRIKVGPQTRFCAIGFGKAVLPMICAVEIVLKEKLHQSIAIAPTGAMASNSRFLPRLTTVREASINNLPDEASLEATREIVEFIRTEDSPATVFLFLISGGGSALLCSPNKISLEQKLSTIKLLASSGANIQQLNTVRQRLSSVKGGKLLENVREAQVVSLIVSDIIGDPVELIASGPTVPQQQERGDALVVLDQLEVRDKIDTYVLQVIEEESHTSRSSTVVNSTTVHNEIICSNVSALSAMAKIFGEEGYDAVVVTSELGGNATEVGYWLAEVACAPTLSEATQVLKRRVPRFELPANSTKVAFLFGGETTVVIRGPGIGGRNQELALAALLRCFEIETEKEAEDRRRFTIMSCGTDGQDGPTDAAGACFDSSVLSDVDVEEARKFLVNSDSYTFWSKFNSGSCHVKTGPSGTNVMDIQLVTVDYGG